MKVCMYMFRSAEKMLGRKNDHAIHLMDFKGFTLRNHNLKFNGSGSVSGLLIKVRRYGQMCFDLQMMCS